MSFSTDIKNEVTRLDSNKEELISELSAIVRNSGVIDNGVTIFIENNGVARRIFKLFDGKRIVLSLYVKVEEDWLNSQKQLFNLGYFTFIPVLIIISQIKFLFIILSSIKYS